MILFSELRTACTDAHGTRETCEPSETHVDTQKEFLCVSAPLRLSVEDVPRLMHVNHAKIKKMRLEKMYMYHLIRALRVVVPLVVLVLVAIPAWNYWSRPPNEVIFEEPLPELVENIAALTEGFKLSRVEGERTVFTIEARTNLGFTDGKNLLEDVTVIFFLEAGDQPERRISSDRCGYDRETGDIRFDGNVEVQLGRSTIGRTSALTYNDRGRTIESIDTVTLSRPGEFEGRADRLSFEMREGIVTLDGGVNIRLDGGMVLRTSIARFHQQENWVEVAGGVDVSAAVGAVHGEDGLFQMEPQSLRPTSIAIRGDVQAQSVDPENPWTLRTQWLQVELGASGLVREVVARQAVVLESGDTGESLYGDEVDAIFDDLGQVRIIDTRGHGRMVFGPDQELRSERIRHELSGSRTTTGEESFLQIGNARAEGSNFVIERDALVRFHTDDPAFLQTESGSSTGDRTQATFDPETKQLLGLVQTGNVRFTRGDQSGTTDRAELQDSGTRILLVGHPVVSDRRLRIEASRIVLDQKTGSFSAIGDVKTVSLDQANPILIVGGRADGSEDKVVYSDGSELWRDRIHVKAQTIEIFPDQQRFVAVGGLDSTMDDVRVSSDRLEFEDATGVAHYAGHVRVRSDDAELDAGDLTLTLDEGSPSRVVARNEVIVRGTGFSGVADEAVYSRSEGTITLHGRDAEISDVDAGSVSGRKLVLNIEDNGIVVVGEDGSRVVSRRFVRQERQ